MTTITIERQTVQQALDVLQTLYHFEGKHDAPLVTVMVRFAELLNEPQPEPVAWWKRHRDGSVELNEWREFIPEDALATGRRPLVFGDTAPPRREWVDLTDAEIEAICDMARPREVSIRIAQQKLKERNHE